MGRFAWNLAAGSIGLADLRSAGITRFHRYYETSDSCPVQFPEQVSSLHVLKLPIILTPTTACRPVAREFPFAVPVSPRVETSVSPITFDVTEQAFQASPLASRLATTNGRIEFTCVSD